jgi:hypothetical protein
MYLYLAHMWEEFMKTSIAARRLLDEEIKKEMNQVILR